MTTWLATPDERSPNGAMEVTARLRRTRTGGRWVSWRSGSGCIGVRSCGMQLQAKAVPRGLTCGHRACPEAVAPLGEEESGSVLREHPRSGLPLSRSLPGSVSAYPPQAGLVGAAIHDQRDVDLRDSGGYVPDLLYCPASDLVAGPVACGPDLEEVVHLDTEA